jgi:hypothetical protein
VGREKRTRAGYGERSGPFQRAAAPLWITNWPVDEAAHRAAGQAAEAVLAGEEPAEELLEDEPDDEDEPEDAEDDVEEEVEDEDELAESPLSFCGVEPFVLDS